MFGALQQLDSVTAVSTDRRITVPSIDFGSISCVHLFMIWHCHFVGHLLDLRFIFSVWLCFYVWLCLYILFIYLVVVTLIKFHLIESKIS